MSAEKSEVHNNIIARVDTRNDTASIVILNKGEDTKMHFGREFSRMSPETRAVVFAGREYFNWQERQNRKESGALGYPRAAAFADGYKGSRSFGSSVPDLDGEEIPQEHKDFGDALNSLSDIRRKVFEGIYRHQWDRRKVARSINGTLRGVDTRLTQAYMILAGILRSKGWSL